MFLFTIYLYALFLFTIYLYALFLFIIYLYAFILLLIEFGNAKHIEVHLKQENANSDPVQIDVDVRVSESYPEILPDILLSSPQLKRDILTIIRKDATECANQFKGDNMIFNLLQNVQENLDKLCVIECTEEDIQTEDTTDVWNVLLTLDHMRSKSKYIKTIQKWTHELDLKGRLIFYRKLIFILLQGEYSNIKVSKKGFQDKIKAINEFHHTYK